MRAVEALGKPHVLACGADTWLIQDRVSEYGKA
jgi:hypothetical protein